MKDLVEIFNMPEEEQPRKQYYHDPLDNEEADYFLPFDEDWAGDLE